MGAGSLNREAGFTFVLLLVMVAAMGVALATAVPWWSHEMQRAKEQDLTRIGNAYVSAIQSYYQASPGSEKQFPRNADDLLLDARFVTVRRHLRQAYADPFTGRVDWLLIRNREGRLIGVRSRSDRVAISQQIFSLTGTPIKGSKYSDLKFIYVPDAT